jgi:hypothetical protein
MSALSPIATIRRHERCPKLSGEGHLELPAGQSRSACGDAPTGEHGRGNHDGAPGFPIDYVSDARANEATQKEADLTGGREGQGWRVYEYGCLPGCGTNSHARAAFHLLIKRKIDRFSATPFVPWWTAKARPSGFRVSPAKLVAYRSGVDLGRPHLRASSILVRSAVHTRE